MISNEVKIQWCIGQHKETNHLYDNYLPYEFHLKMVAQIADEYRHLLSQKENFMFDCIGLACYGHDLIEDARCSYNDVKNVLGVVTAEIVYACTNEKGKVRIERANAKYYEGIRNTPGATFVKLCDRIANVRYSRSNKSRMIETYRRENNHFINSVATEEQGEQFGDMFIELNTLLFD